MGKPLIVCVSVSHANTAKVAREIGRVLHADVIEPELVDTATLADREIVGFGSGIYSATAHPRLRGFIAHLPRVRGTPAFVFTTSGFGRSQSRPWQPSLEDMLGDKGYDVIGCFNCRGFDTWLPLRLVGGINAGHPDEADLADARDFADRLAGRLVRHRAVR